MYYRMYDFKKKVTIINGYYEIPYIDYREDGTIYNIGTEDFSRDRLGEIKTYQVMEKTGEKTKESSIHKGGRNRWKCINYLYVTKRKNAVKVANFLYFDREIQIRK